MLAYYYDYDCKKQKHALKGGEATILENGTARIKLLKGFLDRPAGEWISETMLSDDLKRCIREELREQVKEEVRQEMRRELKEE